MKNDFIFVKILSEKTQKSLHNKKLMSGMKRNNFKQNIFEKVNSNFCRSRWIWNLVCEKLVNRISKLSFTK